MYTTGVTRSYDEAFALASAKMRARFEARVMGADSWTEGIAAALADMGSGLTEEFFDAAQISLAELRQAGGPMRRSYDESRPLRLDAMARAWRHHHPDAPVPELQLEFFTGAVDHVIVAAVQRGDVEDLAARLPGLTVLAPMAGV